MTDVDVEVAVSIATGWLELEDTAHGYEMGAKSFGERTLAAKQRTVGDNAVWMRGRITLASAPDNVTEHIEVYVTGTDQRTFDLRTQAVVDALSQLTFKLRRRIGNAYQTWTCFACPNITIDTQQAYIVATEGLVLADVNRLPDIDRTSW